MATDELISAGRLRGAGGSASAKALPDAEIAGALTEDQALALLRRHELTPEVLGQLTKDGTVMKSRKVKLALLEHPRTPRHVCLPVVRQLFTFELMRVALTPAVPADVKWAAEETLGKRLETISYGERMTLAHRASGRIAAELLLAAEPRVIRAALKNPRLTESGVIQALMQQEAPAALVHAVSHDRRWTLRREVRVALLRNDKTPLGRALEFARSLPPTMMREVLQGSRLPENVRRCLLLELEQEGKEKRSPR